MKSFLAAVAFLTRIPVGRLVEFGAADVGRSFGWFPVVGGLIGLILGGAGVALRGHLPVPMIAVLVVALDALLTGALHLDGLADMADGFGGGKDREDILRIMRDHAIGSYGAVSLILLIALKIAAYSALLGSNRWFASVAAGSVFGRWSLVLLSAASRYARTSPSVVNRVGILDFALATLAVLILLGASDELRLWASAVAVLCVTWCVELYSRRRIGGITGDVLGANLQLSESAVLLAFLFNC